MEDAQATKKEREEKRGEGGNLLQEAPNRVAGQEVPLPTESKRRVHPTNHTYNPSLYGCRRKRPIGSTQIVEGWPPPTQV
ncbi:UNVERIFIED_CONTAM: hypothetical protein Sradi_4923300 [Sesamum radiatum]|uniref:Uncharacterized protein n=1 Tax=Sesamum radiatum TaxID=300843 RepID=A0AAW2MGV7_SESRA